MLNLIAFMRQNKTRADTQHILGGNKPILDIIIVLVNDTKLDNSGSSFIVLR